MTTQKTPEKPRCKLIGQDGNIFNLMGLASRALKQAGLDAESKEMCIKIMGEADSYGAALNIIGNYVDIE